MTSLSICVSPWENLLAFLANLWVLGLSFCISVSLFLLSCWLISRVSSMRFWVSLSMLEALLVKGSSVDAVSLCSHSLRSVSAICLGWDKGVCTYLLNNELCLF